MRAIARLVLALIGCMVLFSIIVKASVVRRGRWPDARRLASSAAVRRSTAHRGGTTTVGVLHGAPCCSTRRGRPRRATRHQGPARRAPPRPSGGAALPRHVWAGSRTPQLPSCVGAGGPRPPGAPVRRSPDPRARGRRVRAARHQRRSRSPGGSYLLIHAAPVGARRRRSPPNTVLTHALAGAPQERCALRREILRGAATALLLSFACTGEPPHELPLAPPGASADLSGPDTPPDRKSVV